MTAEDRQAGKSGRGRTKKPADPNALVPMTFRVPPQIQRAVRHAAIDEDRFVQNITTEALVEWLDTHGHSKHLH